MLKLELPLPVAPLATLTDTDKILGLAARANITAAILDAGAILAATMAQTSVSAENRKLAMRRFQAATIAAQITGKCDAVKEAYQEARPGEWKLVKDAFSKARKLADALFTATAPFPVPTPKASDRKRITIAGKVVTQLDKSHLPALADPLFGDTPVSTLLSKVVEYEAPAAAVTDEQPEAELQQSAENAFMAELQRRLLDPVEFHTLLPLFDAAVVVHSDNLPAEQLEAARLAA